MSQPIDNYMVRNLHDDPYFNQKEEPHLTWEVLVELAKQMTPFERRSVQLGMEINKTTGLCQDDLATLADILLEMEIV